MSNHPAGEPADAADDLSLFRRARTEATRTSALVGGMVAMVGLPLWSVFDLFVAPDDAGQFTIIRLVATLFIAASWSLLFTSFGRRNPEICGLGVIAPVQIAIAAMIVQLGDQHAAYALGMSLAIYAGGLLLDWRLRYTLMLVAISVVSLTVGWLIASDPVSSAEVATVAFYLLTASAVAVAAQLVRDRAAFREFQTRARLEAEQRKTEELVRKLDRLSHEDPLTDLANRRAWDEAIARECARVNRSAGSRTLSVLLCDVDRLKEINDNLGHATGDSVLRRVADLIAPRIRAADLVARIGGDEFAILAIDTDESQAATLAEDIRARVSEAEVGGPTAGVTLSIGVAEWDGPDDSPDTLMLRADRRLYAAKARRNVVCAGDPVEPS